MINFAIPMLANREDILKFIPQRRPIVMVHQLASADDDSATTHFDIEPDNVFIDDGYFAEPGMVENIAQTAAVHIGYQCSKKNIPIPIGYIAAIKDLKVKGSSMVAKQGTAVRNIRLDHENAEYIEGKVDGQQIVIITQYVKKI